MVHHVLLDGADCFAPDAIPPLPRLQRALQGWQALPPATQDAHAPTTPAEVLQATLLQLPGDPAQPPLAALSRGLAGVGCAWFTPCHVQLNMDHAELNDPAQLQLSDDESRALLATLAPLFAEDGIALCYESPLRWFAQGDALRHAAWVSLAQGTRHTLRADLLAPRNAAQDAADRRLLQRLNHEVQMLLYTHPVTDARAARRLPAVNAVWLHGAGMLSSLPPSPSNLQSLPIDTRLLQAAADGQAAWAQAWLTLDDELPEQLAALQAAAGSMPTAQPPSLGFCGATQALRLVPAATGLGPRLARWLKPLRVAQLLAPLSADHPTGGGHAL
ncbi:hypothetical protein CCO03_05570 [Comamonas serinivorans]|uniref:Phosphoglycerate mutase n=1 Tax=Comamonas serinivorans TaxID=1082851 RepID=A0A1Y0EKP0_9BURK|nr:hypothetical protein [Comamonas serinivorans]ARU04215.1 hypothetical protein CCO03_05570 [Comamonas serinivorans]